MDKELLNRLNDDQKKAATSNLGSTMVVAGAGSGKTAVLVYRIAYLITELGLNPKKILAFTFTNKAANEMKKRINLLINNVNLNYIGTFHSICLRILREEISFLGRNNDFSIIDEDDQLSIVREIYAKRQIDKSIISFQNCLNNINNLKSLNISTEEAMEELVNIIEDDFENKKKYVVTVVYKDYQQYLVNNNLLDFDDLIKFAKQILETKTDIRTKWQNRFDYILVDEFQDTNPDQYELIKLLNKTRSNIFVVGDPDQMIYSWRGAYKEIFDDFKKEFNDVELIILDKNYRSTKKILSVSNQLIEKNRNRIKKSLYTENEDGNNVVYYEAESPEQESKWVIRKIKELLRQGYKYKDIAILYRSNFLSRNIEQELVHSGLPYFIFGGFKFYQRKEIKDAIAYLKLISNNDELSLSRIYNTPRRKISEQSLTKIKTFAYLNKINLFDAFKRVEEIDLSKQAINACLDFVQLIEEFRTKKFNSLTEMLDFVLDNTGYRKELIENQEENRLENLEELKNALAQFEFKNPNSTITEYLQEISLYTSVDEESKQNQDCIILMTVHLSKGLEFKNVFIIEFNDGFFPSYKSIDSDAIDEERRIAYVAMTRAQQNLFIANSRGVAFMNDSQQRKMPSRFVRDFIKNEYIEKYVKDYLPTDNNSIDSYYFNQLKDKQINLEDNLHDQDVEFSIGDVVNHQKFGSGVVVGITNDYVDITFKYPYGTKTILKKHKSLSKKSS